VRVKISGRAFVSLLLLIGAFLLLLSQYDRTGPGGFLIGLLALIFWAVYELRVSFGRSTTVDTASHVVRRHSRSIPQDVKIKVSVRDGGKCRVCGSTEDLQYDHIYPWSLGGRSDAPDNIQLLCGYHNRLKSNR